MSDEIIIYSLLLVISKRTGCHVFLESSAFLLEPDSESGRIEGEMVLILFSTLVHDRLLIILFLLLIAFVSQSHLGSHSGILGKCY